MKPDILDYLDEHGVRCELSRHRPRDWRSRCGLPDANPAERLRDVDGLGVTPSIESRSAHEAGCLILHPLPRTVELDKSVDADPRAMYFRQAMNASMSDGAVDHAVGQAVIVGEYKILPSMVLKPGGP